MLDLIIPATEQFDERKMEFVQLREQHLKLEHSLISLSKWESKFKKPFLSSEKTNYEIVEYIRFMTLTQNVDPSVYYTLSEQNIRDITAYINDPMTATTFKQLPKKPGPKEIITAELIYYWMIAFNVPVEFEKWHLNRLLTLLEVCARKQEQPKKMSRKEIAAQHRSINAANRARFNTKG